MATCVNYDFHWWHILLPPMDTIYKMCFIQDKTKLALSTFLRVLLYYLILDYLLTNKYVLTHKEDNSGVKLYMFIFLLVIFLSSLSSMILVLYKKPSLNEQVIEEDAEEQVNEINLEESDVRSSYVKRSVGRSEVEKIFLPDSLDVPGKLTSIS